MAWHDRIGEPLAATREEAALYVERGLKQATPAGWDVRAVDGDPLAWAIVKIDIQADEWPNKEYGVRLSKGLDVLIFTHGNKDFGPFTLHHALLHAIVIDAAALRHFGIIACIERLMSDYQPNEWGYT